MSVTNLGEEEVGFYKRERETEREREREGEKGANERFIENEKF